MMYPRIDWLCLCCLILFGLGASCLADFDEGDFGGYSEGELLGQGGWLPQGLDERGIYTAQEGRAEIRRETDRKNLVLIWKSGFEGREQTRIIKRFPETRGNKAVVKFDFLPGNPSLGAQLVFDRGLPGGEALRFVKGTLRVANLESSQVVDTRMTFEPKDWNRLELQFDFSAHTVSVFLNGESTGSFPLSTALSGLNEIVFFAGGASFESAMADFSVQSVSSFTAPSSGTSATLK